MTCCEGWTSCNGFSLLVLLLLGVILNAIPLIVNRLDEGKFFQNPISCFEWWFPGIIGAGLMVVPATTASLAARKRACCNNRGGMFLSSFLNVLTILGAVYCLLVSAQALLKGPLICQAPDNRTTSCEFSLDKLRIHPEPFDLQWFTKGSCVLPKDPNSLRVNVWRNHTSPPVTDWGNHTSPPVTHWRNHTSPPVTDWGNHTSPPVTDWGNHTSPPVTHWRNHTSPPVTHWRNHTSPPVTHWRNHTSPSGSKEETYKKIHFSVFVGLLLVGGLELLFGLSQILVGFLGCLCGVSKRRGHIV